MGRRLAAIQGLIAGASGAGCMTAIRMAARRAGLIDLTPPQATKAWLTEQAGLEPRDPAVHQLIDAAVHLAVGGGGGAIYGALVDPRSRPTLTSGALFGLGVWAVAFGLLLPWLGVTRSPRRTTALELAVNVAAHLAYGTATAVVTGELAHQTRRPAGIARGWLARVG
jgi:uncharacterized membrane protein YagU involved in acid resistance